MSRHFGLTGREIERKIKSMSVDEANEYCIRLKEEIDRILLDKLIENLHKHYNSYTDEYKVYKDYPLTLEEMEAN